MSCGRTFRISGSAVRAASRLWRRAYYVAIAPHHDGGPVATAAALHLAASVPNFFIQHVPCPEDAELTALCVPQSFRPALETARDGFLPLPHRSGPGHRCERSRRWRNTMLRREFLALGGAGLAS